MSCGVTHEWVCPTCARNARIIRMHQCAEGWHLTEEPVRTWVSGGTSALALGTCTDDSPRSHQDDLIVDHLSPSEAGDLSFTSGVYSATNPPRRIALASSAMRWVSRQGK